MNAHIQQSFNIKCLTDIEQEVFNINRLNGIVEELFSPVIVEKEQHAKRVFSDLVSKIFQIQDALNKEDSIVVGDWLLLKDGTYRMVAEKYSDSSVQLATGRGHYCHVSIDSGKFCSTYSGIPAEIIDGEFILSDEVREGKCWSFLHGVGINKGVDFNLNFRVWMEK